MNSKPKRTKPKILIKDIPVVTYSPGEYERYCEIFASMQNKDGSEFFQNGLPLCRQNTFVHQTLQELSKNENDQKVLRAAYDYCSNQREPKIKNTTTINNVYIKNEVDRSGAQETKGLNKNELTGTTCPRNSLSETACPRNNLLRKI
ncbi:6982_t:CDS:1, partial [Racocetra fulgida]